MEAISYGHLGYPVLQAADILLYKGNIVPVGEDQLPHVEITREISRRFNKQYQHPEIGDVFEEPEPKITKFSRLAGLDGKMKMSKSLGNVIAPEKVIKKHGAEILRLWVSASDYRDDVRISENMLKQMSDAYRRIRNTCRFMLGNLSDFDPVRDDVAPGDMYEIDRFALHNLQDLIRRCKAGYDDYEFHVIYHSLFNYCTLDLSAFYLDILKDRLYTSPRGSLARRSAQSAMYRILDAVVRIMAPVMIFTAEEIWKHMPGTSKKVESVHLADMPAMDDALCDDDLAENWEKLVAVRREVTKVLEVARAEKKIGHPLDADVTLWCSDELTKFLSPYEGELRTIFITSMVRLSDGAHVDTDAAGTDMDGLSISISKATAEKCQRCWIYDSTVGTHPEHPEICTRCKTALGESGE
jgi:isoleucyl-tRNA synthetase